MRHLGVIVDGVFHHPQDLLGDDGRHAITPVNNIVDEIVGYLGRVVMLAQDLPSEDARRAREFVAATHALLSATTSLSRSDQSVFENALRNAVRKK